MTAMLFGCVPARTTASHVPAALIAMALLAVPPFAAVCGAGQDAGAPIAEAIEQPNAADGHPAHPLHQLDDAMLRLPLAALLGAGLALRPRRRGTPPRDPAVIQTQIVLAVVGAIIMLVVGASLARAFGIVGVASLIRYRSKIEDPKDAVVMLSALSVGLASGVGLYALSIFSTLFLVAALWVIESFEEGVKRFDLRVKLGNETDDLRGDVEAVLRHFGVRFELRTSSDNEVCYDVQVPLETRTDRVSNAILRLEPGGHGAVEWLDKRVK